MSRVVVALGGNAIARPGGSDVASQERAVGTAAEQLAEIVACGRELVVTHGNGPQVGNLLVKNELARGVVPPVPLDWCVAQTQATLGFLLASALEDALSRRGAQRRVAAVITRVVVAADDPTLRKPAKPIGRFASEQDARRGIERGETWARQGDRGWRRLVPSPRPVEILEVRAVEQLLDDGHVVVAAGGGGVPMVRDDSGLRGVQAVLDKDLTGALLAEAVGADQYVIATDVDGVALRYGTPEETPLHEVTPRRLRELLAEGHFAAGSMAPKVQAVATFVERGGVRAGIGPLERIAAAVDGDVGTQVRPAERG